MPDPVVVPVAGPDGKFAEGWKSALPEEMRAEKCLDLFQDVQGMAKSLIHAQRAIGKPSLAIPSDKSAQSDWDAWYEAGGRPKSADDYEFGPAKDIPEEAWDKDAAAEFKKLAHSLGLSKKQVTELAKMENARLAKAVTRHAEETESARANAEKTLRAEWKDAYDEQIHLAKAFIAKTTDEGDQRDEIVTLAGNNPQFVKWVAGWGMKMAESKGIDTSQFKRTPSQSLERAEELRSTPGYVSGQLKETDPYRHKKITEELTEIYQHVYAGA